MGRPKTHFTAWHYGLRFTLPDGREDVDNILDKLLHVIYGKEPIQWELFERTIGVETGWETGKPHLHLHFKSFHTDSNFRKTIIKNFMKEINDNRECNNAVYSLKKMSSDDLESYNRFYRYPLKECGLKYARLCKFPDTWENPDYMAQLAKDEMENKLRDIEKSKLIEEKKEAKKGEIILHMEELHSKNPFKNLKAIFVEIIEYYKIESETINLDQGYRKALFFAERFGLTTCEKLVDDYLMKRI